MQVYFTHSDWLYTILHHPTQLDRGLLRRPLDLGHLILISNVGVKLWESWHLGINFEREEQVKYAFESLQQEERWCQTRLSIRDTASTVKNYRSTYVPSEPMWRTTSDPGCVPLQTNMTADVKNARRQISIHEGMEGKDRSPRCECGRCDLDIPR